jgi:hypothetical protein
MRCKKCGGKGFIETFIFRDAGLKPQLQQCCDVKAYSSRVQEITGNTKSPVRNRPTLRVI